MVGGLIFSQSPDALHHAGHLHLLRQPLQTLHAQTRRRAARERGGTTPGSAPARRPPGDNPSPREPLRTVYPPPGGDDADHGRHRAGREPIAYYALPVAPLPQVDFPTISVGASLPGASADIMASSVATPLERQLGHIAGVSEMTSSEFARHHVGITVQFDLSRNIDGAARDVEAAINAARTYLPANLPGNPTYRKVNPADAPIMILSLTSDKFGPSQALRRLLPRSSSKSSRRSTASARSPRAAARSRAVRVEVNPNAARQPTAWACPACSPS